MMVYDPKAPERERDRFLEDFATIHNIPLNAIVITGRSYLVKKSAIGSPKPSKEPSKC